MTKTDAHQIKTFPDPYEPFGISQGFKIGNMIVLSGQVGMDQQGNIVGKGDIVAQAEQAFQNIAQLLAKEGVSTREIVKMTTYVTDMSQVGKLQELRSRLFGFPPPAETLVQVAALALPDLMIEIDAMAITGGVLRPALPPKSYVSSNESGLGAAARQAAKKNEPSY
jgi:enamine deaminase RidA (YjgF/YER057c/UK114 family)